MKNQLPQQDSKKGGGVGSVRSTGLSDIFHHNLDTGWVGGLLIEEP